MPTKILMPALSPTMTHGNLAKWLKQEGDTVKAGEVIAEIETDKATMEVEAVDEGMLAKIIIAEGTEDVEVNKIIAVLLEEDEDKSELENFIASIADNVVDVADQSQASQESQQSLAQESSEQHKSSADPIIVTKEDSKIFISPLARKIAQQENIDFTKITGTGPHGRIIKDDILEAKQNPQSNLSNKVVATGLGMRNSEEYKLIPHSSMRKVIAKRLVESKQTIPHFYLNIECEIDKLLAIRAEMNNAAGTDNPAYKLSVNDFIIKATAMSLKHIPEANASWSDNGILQYNNIDISVAVAIDGGLITPIVRNADQKGISAISNEMKDLALRAKQNKLSPEEFQGGGFSISNLGMFGIKNFNAIVNPPQSCILAIGAASEKAVVRNKNIVTATTMDVTLSCDHRVVDGAVGANFLKALKSFLENPVTMFV